ncbi:MAG TPA: hypothetical protein VF230_17595 [Acidimicrobiales bacterium]
MTDCADSTALRAHLDHKNAALDEHLDTCETCAGLLLSVAADAGFARRELALLDLVDTVDVDVDVEAALAAVTGSVRAPVAPLAAARAGRGSSAGRRVILAGAAALVVLTAAVTPAGRGALAEALDAFRGERLQPVTVDMQAWASSFDADALAALGDVDTTDLSEPDEVAGLAEAETVSGITAPGVSGTPDHVLALAPGTARLVLQTRAGNGVPADLDGAALVVDVPGAIGAIFGTLDGPPEVFVGRSGPLVVRAEGAPLEKIRSFLLSRDELPEELRSQLAAIRDWRSTIPVPVPLDGPGWKEVEVAGRPAIAFGDDTGLGALVIRQDREGVTVVGGRMGVNRALELAGEA